MEVEAHNATLRARSAGAHLIVDDLNLSPEGSHCGVGPGTDAESSLPKRSHVGTQPRPSGSIARRVTEPLKLCNKQGNERRSRASLGLTSQSGSSHAVSKNRPAEWFFRPGADVGTERGFVSAQGSGLTTIWTLRRSISSSCIEVPVVAALNGASLPQ